MSSLSRHGPDDIVENLTNALRKKLPNLVRRAKRRTSELCHGSEARRQGWIRSSTLISGRTVVLGTVEAPKSER